MMIYLHTLGDCLIKVGEREIRPTAPLVFAALLYLGMERGRRVPRAALQELLFPKADERSGAHSLRQLLYKLRQLGAPVVGDMAGVMLSSQIVEVVEADAFPEVPDPDQLEYLSRGVLPGYEAKLSEDFDRWIDEIRSSATINIRKRLLAALSSSRRSGHLIAAQRIATALLRLDPLNEEATLAQAEALALAGQKHEAIRVLDRYSAEVGNSSPHLRIPSDVLRRRIAERLDSGERSRTPLIGRLTELSWLLAQFERAVESAPTVTLVWGEAGIGKTRLLEEFNAHVVLRRARVESANCQPHDIDRPLGVFIDLVPKLLQARGALGVSPNSLEHLRRLAGDGSGTAEHQAHDPERLTAQIRTALLELLLSVASETPLVLLVEDAQWLDHASFRFLLRAITTTDGKVHVVLTLRHRPSFSEERTPSQSVFVRHLESLGPASAATLLAEVLGPSSAVNDETRSECIALAAGNPLFLCTIAEHLRLQGAIPPFRSGIDDLLKQRLRLLEPNSLLMLRFVAALGNCGNQARLSACLRLPADSELLALQDLADRGLVVRHKGSIKCSHDLLADVVLADASPLIRMPVFERVASILERDGIDGKQIGMLWSCAECWRQAENRESELRVLKLCSAFAIEIGQPLFACRALEKALEVCVDGERVALIEETIRVAAMARADKVLIENIARYRAILQTPGRAPEPNSKYDLLEVQAKCAIGEPTWHLRSELLRCALDATVPPSNRIIAARVFLIVATQYLNRAEALRLSPALAGFIDSTSGSFEARELRMLFNTAFGDLEKAKSEAEEMLELVRGKEDLWCGRLGNIARALFYAGATDAGLVVFSSAAQLAERLGLHNVAVHHCGELASLFNYLGDTSSGQLWHRRAEQHLQECDPRYAALQITNRIDVALRTGDLQSARRELDCLRSYPEARTPQAVRFIRGFEILLADLDGNLEPNRIDFTELEELDDAGREAVEHHHFALALYVAYSSSGREIEATSRMRDYVFKHRRERFPLLPCYEIAPVNSRLRTRILADLRAESTN